MATLGTAKLIDLELTIPPAGGWLLTGHLEQGPQPSPGAMTVTVGDLQLPGAILPGRGGLDSPDRPAVVVAGGYGWRTRLPRGDFSSPNGVRLTTVLGAMASISGEPYDVPAEVKLPASYGWRAGTPGTVVLAELVARGALPWWRVDPATGRTVWTPWPALGPADAHGVIEDRMLERAVRYVALASNVRAWLPGATVQGVTIARTIIRERAGETRAEVWDA